MEDLKVMDQIILEQEVKLLECETEREMTHRMALSLFEVVRDLRAQVNLLASESYSLLVRCQHLNKR